MVTLKSSPVAGTADWPFGVTVTVPRSSAVPSMVALAVNWLVLPLTGLNVLSSAMVPALNRVTALVVSRSSMPSFWASSAGASAAKAAAGTMPTARTPARVALTAFFPLRESLQAVIFPPIGINL